MQADTEGERMLTVENDWIEYEPTMHRTAPVRRVAVRGGAACATRIPVAQQRPRTVPVPARTAPAPSAARRRTRLRLTRRGRFVLIVLPSLLALSGALVALTAPGTAEAAPAAAAPATVVIGSGDTLWSLAERIAPQRDPRDVVAAVEAANGLRTAAVQAGQVLVLPARVAG